MSNQTPAIGRIVHVYLETGVVRPAIITRVGPARVAEEDTGQVAYQLFFAPEDMAVTSSVIYMGPHWREGHERKPEETWKPGDWQWPTIAR